MQTHYYARSAENFRGAPSLAARANRLLQAAGTLLILWLLALPAQAQTTAIPIHYTLTQSGKVSLAVYDAQGKFLLTMFSARDRAAGTYDTTWNGKDEAGNLVPNPNTCIWKLLRTPGIQANYVVTVGATFPEGDEDWEVGMGNHLGVRSVAVDSLGTHIYVGSGSAENRRNAMKMTMDGATHIWSAWQPESFQGRFSLAVMNGLLFHLQKNGRIGAHKATLGSKKYQGVAFTSNNISGSYGWNAGWNGALSGGSWSEPEAQSMDMAAYNSGTRSQLVVSYRNNNAVVWFNHKTGAALDTATVTSPEGVAVDNSGNVLVISGSTVIKLNRTSTGITRSTLISGLTLPYRLDVDRTNGTILVAERGNYAASPKTGNQVKRFTSAGAPTATAPVIGTLGGRNYGLYDATKLRDIVDITADNLGGFLIAEGTAPRRLARFNSSGTLVKEWYSGTMWVPGVSIDPDDRSNVWMNITNREIARYKVNYTTKSFTIHSIYKFTDVGGGGVVSPDWSKPYDGMGGGTYMWHARKNAGTTYLVRRSNMQILKLDTIAWQLKLAATGSFGSSAVTFKSDLNNDGTLDDAGEVRTFAGVTGAQATDSPSGFTYYRYVNGEAKVYKYEVDTWTNGSPVYKDPSVVNVAMNVPAFPATTIRALNSSGVPVETYYPEGRYYPKGSGIFAQESSNGPLFVTMTANQYDTNGDNLVDDNHDYGNASHNKMYRVDAGANLNWGVGRHKKRPNGGMRAHNGLDPDSIFTFKSNIGVARGVVIACDYNGGWDGITTAMTYAWDSTGLFVGNLFTNYNTADPKWKYTHSTDNGSGAVYSKASSGIVTYLAGTETGGRLYELTGWTGWTRQSGSVGTPPPAPTGAYAINSGGSAVAPFAADQYATTAFTSATSSTVSTTGVVDPAPASVYQSHRFNSTFSYTFPSLTAGANYKVRLHFAELTWINDGKRVFHVDINGVRKLTNFDIHAKVGYLKATVEEFTVPANTSGQIVIGFSTVVNNASICGIEIIPLTPTTVHAVNSGGGAVAPFAADQYATTAFTSATSSTVSTTGVVDPAPASVYQSHRFNSTFSYTFPSLTAGANYKVRLHFAELTWINDGKRVFHVDINGVRKLTDFDIHAKVGYLKATVEEFTVPANTSGQIVIGFSTVVNNASICGIEIISGAGARIAAEGMGTARPTAVVYPNPAVNEISVVLPQLAGQDVSLQLLNAKGASISKMEKKVDAGGVVRMGVSQVPSGLYFLQVRHAGGALSGKVVIRK